MIVACETDREKLTEIMLEKIGVPGTSVSYILGFQNFGLKLSDVWDFMATFSLIPCPAVIKIAL